MKIRTFSIVAGSMACNARCPFCVAGMTPANGIGSKLPPVNWRNFRKACQLARDGGCTTAMITSKGEPTLFPNQVTEFLKELAPFNFPIIELQTNGIAIADGRPVSDDHLRSWYELGLTTVAISIVSYDPEKNRQNYIPGRGAYIDLPGLIARLHGLGFSVRLTTILARGFCDSVDEVKKLIDFARANMVEQLTMTPVNKPDRSEDETIYSWTAEHHLTGAQLESIKAYLENEGAAVLDLAHGARVYDVGGQNACLNNCLTVKPDAGELRSIIFFPDGHVRYAWQYSGAVLF